MNLRSQRRIEEDDEYRWFKDQKLFRYRRCQVGPAIAVVDPSWRGCLVWSTELHHLRKLSSAGVRVSDANTLASCNPCNAGWVEDNPVLAHRAGLVVRPGDPEWDALGVRVNRLDRL